MAGQADNELIRLVAPGASISPMAQQKTSYRKINFLPATCLFLRDN